MVGVPGRSQSCLTCLSRRKGCDKQRPSCGQCVSSGLTCGGYNRPRTFVNRTQAGGTSSTSYSTTAAVGSASGVNPDASSPQDVTLPLALTQTAYNSRYLDLFWSAYLPGGQLFNANAARLSHGGWVGVALDLYPSDKSLQIAMQAVAMRGAGTLHGDRSLVEQGSVAYTQCLREFNRALRDPGRLRLDGVLCTARLLALYEVHYGANDADHLAQSRSWLAHARGQLAILSARQPHEFRSGKAHQLFSDYRYILIIAAIGERRRFALTGKGWKSRPWKSHSKSPQDKLLDILGDLAGVMEDVDCLKDCEDSGKRSRLKRYIEYCCWNLDAELQAWLAEVGALKNFQSVNTDEEVLGPKDSEDFALAHMTILYWATCVLLYANLLAFVETGVNLPPRVNPSEYAQRLAAALPFFFKPSAGIMGPKMAAFPLGVVLQVLKASDNMAPESRDSISKLLAKQCGPEGIGKFLMSLQQGYGRRGIA